MSHARLTLLFAIAARAAMAHTGEPLEPHDLWTAWEFDPGVVLPLLASAVLYARGARRERGVTRSQAICYWTGWLVLAVALVSPLHPLGEALFSAHMVQHELLMIVAAPLLVFSRPLVPYLWGLPMDARRQLGQWSRGSAVQRWWRRLTDPFTAWWIHAVVLWGWHAPGAFQATLSSDLVHTAQHVSFLGSALLFWWSLFYARGRMAYGAGVLYVFSTAVHTSILGALLTFATTPWYPAYSASTQAWGLSVLEDQQIGGLIMWVPAGVIYTVIGLALFAAWLRESDAVLERSRSYAE